MLILFNGAALSLTAPCDLLALLAARDTPSEGVAAAVNQRVVPRPDWGQTALNENDAVDVFHVIAGG